MTRMSLYEKKRGLKDRRTNQYFRIDYISKQLMISFFSCTISFAVFIGAYMLYHFEELLVEVYSMDVMGLLKKALFWYIVCLAVLFVLTFVVYLRRYNKATRALSRYFRFLERLSSSQDKDRKDTDRT